MLKDFIKNKINKNWNSYNDWANKPNQLKKQIIFEKKYSDFLSTSTIKENQSIKTDWTDMELLYYDPKYYRDYYSRHSTKITDFPLRMLSYLQVKYIYTHPEATEYDNLYVYNHGHFIQIHNITDKEDIQIATKDITIHSGIYIEDTSNPYTDHRLNIQTKLIITLLLPNLYV